MKIKLLLAVFLVSIISISVFAQGVKLQFITVNQYGNNLYLDNVTLGNQFNNDVGVGAINNINPGTSYAIGTAPFIVTPDISVLNVGKDNVTAPFNVTMTVTPGGYSSTKPIAFLSSGQSTNVIFDNLTITPGIAIEITITTQLAGDENSANNTLVQNSNYLPGVQRTVLLEEWTSSTCAPCAGNNPTVDAFITARFDSLVAIKYHMNWPSPGNDPMYLYNPTQATDRRSYYAVNSVPHVIMDGVVNPEYPYSNAPSLPGAFNPRKLVGSPLSVTVTDTKVGDSIRTAVVVNVVSPLPTGNYYLRVHAVERHIHYSAAPGSNGETDFYDVFRKAYPTSLGTVVPTAVGNYVFNFTYALDHAVWVDSMIYTAAFVQNDATKEVLNSGKARHYADQSIFSNVVNTVIEKPVLADNIISNTESMMFSNQIDALVGTFHYNLFESAFPPAGWSLINPDGGITFAQFIGANGPTLGGTKSVKMDFYSYSTAGRIDTLISAEYYGLTNTDSVKFNYAYAQYATENDRLVVRLSKDGGLTYPYTLFDKAGAQLATAPATTNSFTPAANQWATFSYSLDGIVPVELTAFTASVNGNNIQLNWATASETNNNGFEIQKKLGEVFVTVAFIKGAGTTTEAQSYSFLDKDVLPGVQSYRLKQIDFSGVYQYSNIVEAEVTGPKVYSLDQNYPNPFNPSTKISFSLAGDSKVSLKVFNLLGQEVANVFSGILPAGPHKMSFDGSGLNSGIYFYRIETSAKDGSSFVDVKKMTLIK